MSARCMILAQIPGGFLMIPSLSFIGVSLKGDTYWVAEDKRERSDFFLTKFDFTAERFVSLPLPIPASFDSQDDVSLSVVRDEKLSVLQIDESSGAMRIWVSNKIDDEEDFSWRSDVVLTVDFDEFNLPSVASFLLDEENKVAVCCDGNNYTGDGYRTSIYVVGEDMCEQVYEDTTEASHLSFPLLLTYLPSLVLIQPKRQHKRRRLSDT